jgi:hypothetical protein
MDIHAGFSWAPCLWCFVTIFAVVDTPAAAQAQRVTVLDEFQSVQALYNRRRYAEAEKHAYPLLWQTMERPGALELLSKILAQQDRDEEAAAYLTFFHRLLVEKGSEADKRKFLTSTERRLNALNREYDQRVEQYLAGAAGKQFTSPTEVDDLWMTQVSTQLLALHTLYAWKLNGGKPDTDPNWIHNRQGVMHRSGMKLCEEVDVRKGVLFTAPFKEDSEWVKHWGSPLQITTHNPGKCKYLRIGAKGYGFPVLLRIVVDGRTIDEVRVDQKSWHDLKIDLKDAAAAEEIFVQLLVPEGQQYHEGVWFDYVDFFDS